ncbi:MAG: insulinase family protein, partial [Spirochaetaceae bacterium]|nr:insulinase family protein [Spirochaetaceae bacterium]
MKTLRRILFTSPVRALWLCAILLVSCATAARGPLEQDPAVRSGVLANGLTYRILRNTQPGNRLFLRLVVKAGSVLEDDDQRGLAHLVEHMAFKNTAHFAENELIKYFESIGMAFGPDVNAYTSYDQTVYMLEIPADSGEALDTALTVIGDWAWGVTFEEEALQKERDVVIEEWRLDRGFSGRVQDAILPFLFQGSRYADRATIGVPEVIKNAPRERIVDFYETWYRTNLLTVLIVGDADPDVIEGAVREKLSEIPEDSAIHRKKAARPEYPVPLSRDEAALVITDPESPYPMAQLYEFFPARPVRSRGDFKNRLLRQVASDILGERLNERAEQGAPFLRAGSSFYHLIRPLWAGSTAFIPREGQFEGAFKAVLDEMDRFRAFGVTQGELDRQKQNQLAWADQAWQNRDKTESSALIGALIGSELYGEPFLSPEARHELVGSLIGEISVKEVNRTIASYFGSRGKFLIVTAPEDSPLPPAAEIEDLWKNYRSKTPLAPPQDDGHGRPLFSPSPDFAPGKVVSEESFSLGAGDSPRTVTVFTLS